LLGSTKFFVLGQTKFSRSKYNFGMTDQIRTANSYRHRPLQSRHSRQAAGESALGIVVRVHLTAQAICLQLFMQEMRLVRSLARDSAGKSMAARMAIMAITTNSSISVKAELRVGREFINFHRRNKAVNQVSLI